MPVWNDSPTTFAYQWKRCDADGDNCADIAGAKGATYVLVKADEGSTIKVRQDAHEHDRRRHDHVRRDGRRRRGRPGRHRPAGRSPATASSARP